MTEQRQFGAVDFIVFIGMLLMSMGVGIYYAWKDKKNNSVDNYYFGGRNMSPIPVGLSIAATFISSLTILGIPSHTYRYGTIIFWIGILVFMMIIFACIYYIPLFHRHNFSSAYEYFEIRFHRSVRMTSSVMVMVLMILYMGIIIYLTSLALVAVSPLGLVWSIILISGICTFYTTLGGMKAVIWNDALQAFIMMGGILLVSIKAVIEVGGFQKMSEALERGRRHTMWDSSFNPTKRHTIWTFFIGYSINWIKFACTNQTMTQRYQSCKSTKDSIKAMVIAFFPITGMLIVSTLTGCAMYAYYEGCDPVTDGRLDKIDQITPYFVMDLFQNAPGVTGLFVSAAFSGMLSTVSSGINSLSALILEDFVLYFRPTLKENFKLGISKFLSLALGVLSTVIAFLMQYMGNTVLQISDSFSGTLGGPILGVFIAGMHFPWTNTTGAICGVISGVCISNWIAIGGIFYKTSDDIPTLPFSTEQCFNSTDVTSVPSVTYNWTTTGSDTYSSSLILSDDRPLFADTLYSVSYLYLGTIGMLITLLVAGIVSLITGVNDPKTMNPSTFVPLIDNKILPEKVRKFFRFGVPEYSQVSLNQFEMNSVFENLIGQEKDDEDFDENNEGLRLVEET